MMEGKRETSTMTLDEAKSIVSKYGDNCTGVKCGECECEKFGHDCDDIIDYAKAMVLDQCEEQFTKDEISLIYRLISKETEQVTARVASKAKNWEKDLFQLGKLIQINKKLVGMYYPTKMEG